MATNGNHPNPTQQLEALQAVASAATTAASNTVEDVLAKAEAAFDLLEVIARELGSAGGADEREIVAFTTAQRADLHAFVRKLVNRYRRRAADLERITGKTEG